MTDPEHPDHRPSRLPTGSHHDRARAEQIAEARSMIALWERALFRGKKDAREQLAFWRGVLARLQDQPEEHERNQRPADCRGNNRVAFRAGDDPLDQIEQQL